MDQNKKQCKGVNCNRKGEWLSLTEFYQYPNNDYYAECKECHKQHTYGNKEMKAMAAIETLLQLGMIQHNEVSASNTLYKSCTKRIEACKYNSGIYKDVKCDWESPLSFMIDIIQQLPDMWSKWKIQNAIYHETQHNPDRPTIDRIDEFGNYTISNIQMLSKSDNSKKASSKPCKVLIIKDCKMKGVFEFESKKDLLGALIKAGIPINTTQMKFDTGQIQEVGNGYSVLLQSKNGKLPTTGEPFYEITINRRRELIDAETREVVQLLGHWEYKFDALTLKI